MPAGGRPSSAVGVDGAAVLRSRKDGGEHLDAHRRARGEGRQLKALKTPPSPPDWLLLGMALAAHAANADGFRDCR